MIADATFLIDLLVEQARGRAGPATALFASHRPQVIRTCIICLAEVAVSFPTSAQAWDHYKAWRIYPLHRGIAQTAADVDRQLIQSGDRLGENDNWIAAFGLYYREPVISLDAAFDRVPGLRRVAY